MQWYIDHARDCWLLSMSGLTSFVEFSFGGKQIQFNYLIYLTLPFHEREKTIFPSVIEVMHL